MFEQDLSIASIIFQNFITFQLSKFKLSSLMEVDVLATEGARKRTKTQL